MGTTRYINDDRTISVHTYWAGKGVGRSYIITNHNTGESIDMTEANLMRLIRHGDNSPRRGNDVSKERCPEFGVRGTQCLWLAGHFDDCQFAPTADWTAPDTTRIVWWSENCNRWCTFTGWTFPSYAMDQALRFGSEQAYEEGTW